MTRKGLDIIPFEDREKPHHREVVGYYSAYVAGEEVYVVRTAKIAALSGGTAPLKGLTKLLDERGYLVASTKGDSRTWSGFPGLGKEGQYVVIRMSAVDAK